jgi:hypothetical protein
MDDHARAIMDMARETLARVADVRVVRRVHRDDGLLTEHSVNMPKKEPPPTVAEVKQMIAEALAELPHALTSTEIERMIEAHAKANEWHHEATLEAIGQALGETRKKMRAEFEEQLGLLRADVTVAKADRAGEEFFYFDSDGVKQDAELHGPILRAVDYPIDEKIMGPIRARNRAKYLAEQKAKRDKTRAARIIDLPALPLRSPRRG